MPRPCVNDHLPSPSTCRLCRWCADDSETGAAHRRLWGEPGPNGGLCPYPAREIVPGLSDPIPDPLLRPAPPSWTHDPKVMARHGDALRRLAASRMPRPGRRSGAGVVMVGGGKYWPGIVVSLRMLRETGCALPVQVWHRGAVEPVHLPDLDGLRGVSIHDSTSLHPVPRSLGGWENKTVALLACGWQRVFYIDSDAYCLHDPTTLLDRLAPAQPFLYWEDQPAAGPAVRWSAWGLRQSAIPPIQGGQFALHVKYFWRELVLAHWLNQHSDFAYAHQYGDQDSWRVALAVTEGPHACLGPSLWDKIAHVYHLDSVPVIVHRCQAKMFYPEDVEPGDMHSNRRNDHLPGEARAWAHWHALRSYRQNAHLSPPLLSSS